MVAEPSTGVSGETLDGIRAVSLPWDNGTSCFTSLNQRGTCTNDLTPQLGKWRDPGRVPCGTVTSFPSTVRVMPARSGEVDVKVLRPKHVL